MLSDMFLSLVWTAISRCYCIMGIATTLARAQSIEASDVMSNLSSLILSLHKSNWTILSSFLRAEQSLSSRRFILFPIYFSRHPPCTSVNWWTCEKNI
ncbi:hypothetical protein EDD22DRAFT_919528 [Suillus occidentalis]|nr:hypothetical protein EDD22DRAFT_919528 [Suillus occidentalis]